MMARLHREKYFKFELRIFVLLVASGAMCSAGLITTESAITTDDTPRSSVAAFASPSQVTNRGSTKFHTTLTTVKPLRPADGADVQRKRPDVDSDNVSNELDPGRKFTDRAAQHEAQLTPILRAKSTIESETTAQPSKQRTRRLQVPHQYTTTETLEPSTTSAKPDHHTTDSTEHSTIADDSPITADNKSSARLVADDSKSSTSHSSEKASVQPATTTEPYHFDLSKFTSEFHLTNTYSDPLKAQSTTKQVIHNEETTKQQPTFRRANRIRSTTSGYSSKDSGEYITYERNFAKPFENIHLTTPPTASFDEIHRHYQEEDNDDEDRKSIHAKSQPSKYDSHFQLAPSVNSTNERNSTHYSDVAEVETRSYSVSTNDVRNNSSMPDTTADTENAKLILPSAAEVWALAAMKKEDYIKEQRGQAFNVTSTKDDRRPSSLKNNTEVIKQLADWASVMQDGMVANYTINNTTISNRGSIKHKHVVADSAAQENQMVMVQTVLPPPGFNGISETVTVQYSEDNENQIGEFPKGDKENMTSKVTDNIVNIAKHFDTNYINSSDVIDVAEHAKTNVSSTLENSKIINLKITTELPSKPNTQPDIDQEVIVTGNAATKTEEIPDTKGDIDQKVIVTGNAATTTEEIPKAKTLDINGFVPTTIKTIDEVTTTIQTTDNTLSTTDKDVILTTSTEDKKESSTDANLNRETLPKTSNTIEEITEIHTTENTRDTTNVETTLSQANTSEKDFLTDSSAFTNPTTDDSSIENNLINSTSNTNPSTAVTNPITTTEKMLPTHTNTASATSSLIIIPTTSALSTSTVYDLDDDLDFTTFPTFADDDDDSSDWEILLTTLPPSSVHTVTTDHAEYKTTEPVRKEMIKHEDTEPIAMQTEQPTTSSEKTEQPRNASVWIAPTLKHLPATHVVDGYSEEEQSDVNAIIAVTASVVGIVCLVLLVGFLLVMRKRQKLLTYSQRCRPVGLDAYSLDNVSVFNSIRRKGSMRQSKRAYGNAGFEDPDLKKHVLTLEALATFVTYRPEIYKEFKELPVVTARIEDVPKGCEDKNRYANIVPLPETRVILNRIGDDDHTTYINANFVRGPKDAANHYIATQAPLEHTMADFWRMIWEQNSRVIIMATDLNENGIERCAEYVPPSVVLDNVLTFDNLQVTLKSREVRDKYAVSTLHLLNTATGTWREITHFWYQWPFDLSGPAVPEKSSVVAMLLEAQSFLKVTLPDQTGDCDTGVSETDNGQLRIDIDATKSLPRSQGPLTVHCSPGTGRTGTLIACDMALRELEMPTRSVDIPRIVYFVRNGRANAVVTREQYEFIYEVANLYATKISTPSTPE